MSSHNPATNRVIQVGYRALKAWDVSFVHCTIILEIRRKAGYTTLVAVQQRLSQGDAAEVANIDQRRSRHEPDAQGV